MTRRAMLVAMDMDEADLEAQGWTKQATYDEPRLGEMVATYRELGFEVRLEPARLDDGPCRTCLQVAPERFRTIYTRRRSPLEQEPERTASPPEPS